MSTSKPFPPGPYLWVSGPRPHGEDAQQVRVKTKDGKVHARCRVDPREAHRLADEARTQLVGKDEPQEPQGGDFRPYDGTSAWWSDLLGQASLEAFRDPTDANLARVRSLAAAARAAGAHIDTMNLEVRLGEVEKRQRKIDATAKHGTGAQRKTRPSHKAPKPGTPVN